MDRRGWGAVAVIFFLIVTGGSAMAETGSPLEVAWTWTTGGEGRDTGGTIAVTPDGDILLAGTTTDEGGTQAFLQRRDSDGTIEWTRRYGGDRAHRGVDVLALKDGGAILLESTRTSEGNNDALLRRVDASGAVVWTQQYGTEAGEFPWRIVRAGDGYAFAGYAAGTENALVAWLVRVGPSGEQQWVRTYDAGSVTAVYDLIATDDGFVLAGVTTNGRTVLAAGDGWLTSVRSDGSVRWMQRYGGTAGDSLQSVIEVPGGFALAGFTTSYGSGASSAWLVRTDTKGKIRWNRTYGSAHVTVASDLVRTEEGFLVLGEGAPDGDFDIQFRRISTSGGLLDTRAVGGDGEEGAGDLILFDGKALATGTTSTDTGAGRDIFVVAVKAPAPVQTLDGAIRLIAMGVVVAVIGVATLLLRHRSDR